MTDYKQKTFFSYYIDTFGPQFLRVKFCSRPCRFLVSEISCVHWGQRSACRPRIFRPNSLIFFALVPATTNLRHRRLPPFLSLLKVFFCPDHVDQPLVLPLVFYIFSQLTIKLAMNLQRKAERLLLNVWASKSINISSDKDTNVVLCRYYTTLHCIGYKDIICNIV